MLRVTCAMVLPLLLLGTLNLGLGGARADDISATECPERPSLSDLRFRALADAAGSFADDRQTFSTYTTISALQLAGTMVVNPSRLETIEVVGAFALGRVVCEVGDQAIKAAIDGGQAKVAVRGETGDLISFDVGPAGWDIEELTKLENAYFLAKSPDLLPSKPDFRAIDWNAPRDSKVPY